MISAPDTREIILLVEDDKLLSRLAADTLREEGYIVIQANDAEAALTYLQRSPTVGLLVTDVNMPGKSGLALAREAMLQVPGLNIIFISGRTVGATQLPAGTDFLQKPFTAHQLISAVRRRTDHAGR